MAMDGFTKDMNIIQQLNDEPNDRDGLTAGELKAKFDEGGLAVKDYLNNTVKPYVEGLETGEAEHEADTVRHITAAERTAWNGKYDKTGGTLTGNVTVQQNGTTPSLSLNAPEKANVGRSRTILYKNASASADSGTQLTDYVWGDGTTANQRTMLRLRSSSAEPKDRLTLIDYAAGGNYVLYHLFGEHNPPAVADVTGLQTALDGKVDKVSGKGLSTNDYTAADKAKLDGVAAGAEVNQNAFSHVKVGSTTVSADGKTDTLTLVAGDNITITPDATNDKVTIAATDTTYSSKAAASGGTAVSLVTTGEKYTWNSKQNALTFDNAPTAGSSNPVKSSGIKSALDGKAATNHTHSYLPLSGGTLTGDVLMQKNIPRLTLETGAVTNVGRARLILYKNTSTTVDNGTQLADYVWGDGGAATNKNARIVVRAAATALYDMLTLNVNEGTGGSTAVYRLYGEHNKPYVTAGQKSGTTLGAQATAEGNETTASGDYSHAEGYQTTASNTHSHAEGYATVASGYGSHAEGSVSVANGLFSHAEGVHTTANGGGDDDPDAGGAHAEGKGTTASGHQAHAEGLDTTASGHQAHAEGNTTTASGDYSHAEGFHTKASQNFAHAEGMNTTASGYVSHAEGNGTTASGDYSHAEGYGTIAAADYQHVSGKYNVSDPSALEIVGWGTSNTNRQDVRALDRYGNEWIAGTLTQASDARLKDVGGEVPDLSGIRAVRFQWNEAKGEHDDRDHIGYIAQDVEAVAPYLVGEDSNGYKSLDYIALLTAKVEMLERQVAALTAALNRQ